MEIARLQEFVQRITPGDNLAVFYHEQCTDGLCSGVITAKAFERLSGVTPVFRLPYQHVIDDATVQFLKEKKVRKAVFVDLYPDRFPEKVREAEQTTELLIIDHHKFKTRLDSKRTLVMHADTLQSKLDGAAYPASKLCYDVFAQLTKMEDVDWIACVGLIGDMGFQTWKRFVQQVAGKYGFRKDELVLKTELGRISTLLSTTNMFPDTAVMLFEKLAGAKKPQEILDDPKLLAYEREAKAEITLWIEKAKDAEVHGDLVIFEVAPKLGIGASVSTALSLGAYKEKTVVVIADYHAPLLSLHARDQRKKIKLNELLHEVARELPGAFAGGHIPAAGGSIRREDREKFKQRLIKLHAAYAKKFL